MTSFFTDDSFCVHTYWLSAYMLWGMGKVVQCWWLKSIECACMKYSRTPLTERYVSAKNEQNCHKRNWINVMEIIFLGSINLNEYFISIWHFTSYKNWHLWEIIRSKKASCLFKIKQQMSFNHKNVNLYHMKVRWTSCHTNIFTSTITITDNGGKMLR